MRLKEEGQPKIAFLPLEHPASLSDLTYQALKEAILNMDYASEGRLDERDLAESLRVSRTPLRDAIRRLVSEGFLRVEPRKGVYVVRKTRQEIIEILYVRAALEGMAAKLCVRNITDEAVARMREIFAPFTADNVESRLGDFSEANVLFHEFVLKLSNCQKLQEMATNIFDHMRMVRIHSIRTGGRSVKAIAEHLDIIEAIERRDGEAAAERMRRHIEDLALYVEKNRGLFPWGPLE
ncbi:MAG: GntR family transcriptional regulator [Syntrophobacteraceae bacterium]